MKLGVLKKACEFPNRTIIPKDTVVKLDFIQLGPSDDRPWAFTCGDFDSDWYTEEEFFELVEILE